MFVKFTEAQYRALNNDAFEARRSEVIDLLNADELPEGITTKDLLAERDMILADIERREAAVQLRDSKAAAVAAGAGNVIASSKDLAIERSNKGFKAVSEPNFTDTFEYRKALADHIARRSPMPRDIQQRAAVSVSGGDYTAAGDFTEDYDTLVAIPNSLMAGIIQEEKEYGHILPKVRQVSLKGGITYTEADLDLTASWIGDTAVSDYQQDSDGTTFSFTWHQLECRFARTMLADALMRDDFKALLAPALAKARVDALEAAIIAGNGTTQPLGITTDTRLIGGTGITAKALVVNVTAAQMDAWDFWYKLLYNTTTFNRLYRQRGEWIFGDSTWGLHLGVLKDADGDPLSKVDPLNSEQPQRLRNRPVNLVEDTILPSFDAASSGDVIGIFGNLNNYVLNTQPGMPMSTVTWDDHENNLKKTKMLTAVDGRVVNPYGWAILKKA